MPTDKEIAEHLRRTSHDFRELEKAHHRLDAELLALLKHHALTPREERRKTQIQKEKLDKKDHMAERIRDYRNAHAGTAAS